MMRDGRDRGREFAMGLANGIAAGVIVGGLALIVVALTGCAQLGGWIDAVPWPTNDVPPVVESTTTTIPPVATTTTQPPAPVEGLTFKMHSPRHNYVSWGFADRSGWPVVDMGKACNGLLYLNGKKVEWIPVGRENTGVENALGVGGKYSQNLQPGDVMRLEIRDIKGKLRNPAYTGTVVYK